MTQIEHNVEALVRKIKKDDKMKDYCFVKGFKANEHQNPIESYMIAVSTLDAHVGTDFVSDLVGENLKGSMYLATVKFRVYAPKNDGGDGLTSVVYELCEAIKRSDSFNVCEKISTTGIAFDNEAMTVYRDVVAQLSFCLYEEVTG